MITNVSDRKEFGIWLENDGSFVFLLPHQRLQSALEPSEI